MLIALCCNDRCNLASLLILPCLDYILCVLFINMHCPIKINQSVAAINFPHKSHKKSVIYKIKKIA